MDAKQRRVVITGYGAISPLGLSAEATWAAARAGQSGVRGVSLFDPAGLATTFAGEVPGFDPVGILGRKESRRLDRYSQLAVAAALQAVAQAELNVSPENADRVGALIGTGIGGIATLEEGAAILNQQGPRRLSPFFVPMMLPNMASGNVAIAVGAKGPNFATVSACASSAHAIGEAARLIRRGEADVILAGGGEAPVTRLAVAGFNAMGALSTRNEAPAAASRPFDAERDGFVLAEGAAILVLEAEEVARGRGARIAGEVLGYGTTDDAHHIVQPGAGGEGVVRAIRRALTDAGLGPDQIDYINAHGTSTQLNEKLETAAIKTAFGDRARHIPISSTKSMTGHLLGAAGALEAVISLEAMAAQYVPPTINYEHPDPDCDLDYVPNEARPATLNRVMSNSMGFGGHNVSLIFGKGVS